MNSGTATTELPKQPLVSIDTVPLLVRDGRLHVVLGERLFEPFIGEAALPGVLLLSDERMHEAALRALESKIGVRPADVLAVSGAGVFDNPDRDPRGPTISIVHTAVLRPGLALAEDGVHAVPLEQATRLPFDHEAIIRRTAGTVLDTLWRDIPLTRALLGETFSTADAARRERELAAAAGRPEPDTSNLGRAFAKSPLLAKAAAAATPSGKGKPPALWAWTEVPAVQTEQ
ncbi:NUDIX domain-containing protein [Arthrobacter celericrescens]|uniref:NUDIX domain-containing protein n=1 Tax=Arthrobacter celericrescens TaxID=2320851 RepID=UPI000EA1C227|nr:NUDIX domain-containing protein [Arthrobacter celericrescens]